MELSLEHFRSVLRSVPCPLRYWIAYSGGLDSHVLVHLCAHIQSAKRLPSSFLAVHIHHGLQPQADAWAGHCRRVCANLNIQFLEIRVDARPQPGQSPEEAARNARYRAFRSVMHKGDVLLTAQHQDDQAETVLLQLMRGAGLAGIAAMPLQANFAPGLLLRPLLQYSRDSLRSYALAHRLDWVEDPSNRELGYDRNFIRQSVLPLLAGRWPGIGKVLGRTASHCAEALQHLEDLAEELYQASVHTDGHTLRIDTLKTYKAADQRLVLRYWLKHEGFRMPTAAILQRILNEVLSAGEDRTPLVSWSEGEIRRYRDQLFVMRPLPSPDNSQSMVWNGRDALDLPHGNGQLSVIRVTESKGIAQSRWDCAKILVRYRQGGESCTLPGRHGTHSLKKLFQECGIPPWERNRMPLIILDGQLAAIGERWVCAPYAAAEGEPAVRVCWRRGEQTIGRIGSG